MKSPKPKLLLHALLLTIGCGGLVHLVGLFITGLFRHDLRYFNPAYAVDFDQLWPASNSTIWFMIVGWVGFFSLIAIAYYLLVRRNKK